MKRIILLARLFSIISFLFIIISIVLFIADFLLGIYSLDGFVAMLVFFHFPTGAFAFGFLALAYLKKNRASNKALFVLALFGTIAAGIYLGIMTVLLFI